MKETGGAREYFGNSYVRFGKEHVSCFRAIPPTGKRRAGDTLHMGRDSILALCVTGQNGRSVIMEVTRWDAVCDQGTGTRWSAVAIPLA